MDALLDFQQVRYRPRACKGGRSNGGSVPLNRPLSTECVWQEDMPYFRRRMVHEILTMSLLP